MKEAKIEHFKTEVKQDMKFNRRDDQRFMKKQLAELLRKNLSIGINLYHL